MKKRPLLKLSLDREVEDRNLAVAARFPFATSGVL
jgi:hypothetical protein